MNEDLVEWRLQLERRLFDLSAFSEKFDFFISESELGRFALVQDQVSQISIDFDSIYYIRREDRTGEVATYF